MCKGSPRASAQMSSAGPDWAARIRTYAPVNSLKVMRERERERERKLIIVLEALRAYGALCLWWLQLRSSACPSPLITKATLEMVKEKREKRKNKNSGVGVQRAPGEQVVDALPCGKVILLATIQHTRRYVLAGEGVRRLIPVVDV